MQCPFAHVSTWVQALPSSQAVPFAVTPMAQTPADVPVQAATAVN